MLVHALTNVATFACEKKLSIRLGALDTSPVHAHTVNGSDRPPGICPMGFIFVWVRGTRSSLIVLEEETTETREKMPATHGENDRSTPERSKHNETDDKRWTGMTLVCAGADCYQSNRASVQSERLGRGRSSPDKTPQAGHLTEASRCRWYVLSMAGHLCPKSTVCSRRISGMLGAPLARQVRGQGQNRGPADE